MDLGPTVQGFTALQFCLESQHPMIVFYFPLISYDFGLK